MEQEKSKKWLIGVLIVIIVLLLCVIGYLLFGKELLNGKIDNNTITTTQKNSYGHSCYSIGGTNKCISLKEGNIELSYEDKVMVHNGDFETVYYINGNPIFDGQKILGCDGSIIENDYALLDCGVISSSYYLFDKNGKEIKLDSFKDFGIGNAKYENGKLIISGGYILDNIDKNELCSWTSLDTIVYLKQEVDFINGGFKESKTIESKTLKQAAKEYFGKEC